MCNEYKKRVPAETVPDPPIIWKYVALAAIGISILFRGFTVSGSLIGNLGMISFRDIVLSSNNSSLDTAEVRYPLQQIALESDVRSSIQLLETALRHHDNSWHSHWRLGRAALAAGNQEFASEVLASTIDHAKYNRLLYYDALSAFYYAGNSSLVIELDRKAAPPEAPPNNYERKDLYNLMQDALSMLAASYHEIGGSDSMQRIAQLRPGDLRANYHLWKGAFGNTDEDDAALHRATLEHSPAFITDLFLQYDVEVIPDLLVEEVWTRERVRDAVVFVVWRWNSDSSVEGMLHKLHTLYPGDPFWTFYLGELYRLRGEIERAASYYEQTVATDSSYRLAYIRRAMMAQLKCTQSNADCDTLLKSVSDLYQQYQQLYADDVIGLQKLAELQSNFGSEQTGTGQNRQKNHLRETWKQAALSQGPQVMVDQKVAGTDWIFLGYSGDEAALIRGEQTAFWLYWQGPPGARAGTEANGWYHLGEDIWIQIIEEAENLIVNGGFELSISQQFPGGFPYDRYGCETNAPELIVLDRSGTQTTTALLDNRGICQRRSLVSTTIKINPNALYLQAGWVLNRGGNPLLGRNWLGDIRSDSRTYSYSRMMEGSYSDGWQLYAGIAEPLPGSKHAEIWLLNYESSGLVYFDNIMFIMLDRPGMSS